MVTGYEIPFTKNKIIFFVVVVWVHRYLYIFFSKLKKRLAAKLGNQNAFTQICKFSDLLEPK